MQLARISHASLEARAAAYLEGKVVDLQAAHARAEGRPDPLYAGLAGLLAAGADALARTEELARGHSRPGRGGTSKKPTFSLQPPPGCSSASGTTTRSSPFTRERPSTRTPSPSPCSPAAPWDTATPSASPG